MQATSDKPAQIAPVQAVVTGANVENKPRRAATRAEDKLRQPRRGMKVGAVAIIVGLTLMAGVAVGALVERNHHRAVMVVASINGDTINSEYLNGRLQSVAGEAVMKQIVDEKLQLQFAAKMGVPVTDAEVEQIFAKKSKAPDFNQTLVKSHQSVEDFKRELRVELARAAVMNKGISVTEAESRQYYKANIDPANANARYYTPESAQIAAIVTATEQDGKKALFELHNGRPFQTVVQDYSQDSSKLNNGIFPALYKGRSNLRKVAGLEDAIFNLKIGGQIGPQKFDKAWWIIRCLDRTAAKTQPFEAVKEECEIGAKLVKSVPLNFKTVQKDFTDFRHNSALTAFWSQYASALQP